MLLDEDILFSKEIHTRIADIRLLTGCSLFDRPLSFSVFLSQAMALAQ